MTKIVTIEVNACYDCIHYYQFKDLKLLRRCTLMNPDKQLEEYEWIEIPIWCPLPDKEE